MASDAFEAFASIMSAVFSAFASMASALFSVGLRLHAPSAIRPATATSLKIVFISLPCKKGGARDWPGAPRMLRKTPKSAQCASGGNVPGPSHFFNPKLHPNRLAARPIAFCRRRWPLAAVSTIAAHRQFRAQFCQGDVRLPESMGVALAVPLTNCRGCRVKSVIRALGGGGDSDCLWRTGTNQTICDEVIHAREKSVIRTPCGSEALLRGRRIFRSRWGGRRPWLISRSVLQRSIGYHPIARCPILGVGRSCRWLLAIELCHGDQAETQYSQEDLTTH